MYGSKSFGEIRKSLKSNNFREYVPLKMELFMINKLINKNLANKLNTIVTHTDFLN